MIKNETVKLAQDYVLSELNKKTPPELTYHTADHTKRVVENATLIGSKESLTEAEMNLLLICTWFHDIGYISKSNGHEKISAEISKEFLLGMGVEKETASFVSDCILSTAHPQTPKNKIAEILCDADMMHLGSNDYFILIKKLRKEWKNKGIQKSKKYDFFKLSEEIFVKHRFHTPFCQRICQTQKNQNLLKLREIISSLEKKSKIPAKKKKSNKKTSRPRLYSRGVDSMFKLTARNQINLSSIADNKSNILISINAIIISVIITMLVRKFPENPNIIIPTVTFLSFSLATIIIAILSTRPQISSGIFSKEDIKQMKANLLFFGNFYRMDIKDYEWAVEEMINNDTHLYSTMIKDQYYLGVVLAKKYRLLRIAYNIFMIGMVVSVIAFILVFTILR